MNGTEPERKPTRAEARKKILRIYAEEDLSSPAAIKRIANAARRATESAKHLRKS